MKQKTSAIYFLMLSAIAFLLLVIVAVVESNDNLTLTFDDRLAVGVVFVAACVFGTSLSFFPGWHRRIFDPSRDASKAEHVKEEKRGFSGHHPDCSLFDNHRISIRGKNYCAGCLGISLGSILSIIFMVIYVLFAGEKLTSTGYLFFTIGFFLIVVAYVEVILPRRNITLHLMSNALLIGGFLFIVIGLLEITGWVYAGLLGILFCFLWMDTRIQLSKWRHHLMCSACNGNCKIY